jgi:hypothetical protein
MSTGPKYKGHATCSTVGPAKIVWILSNECCPVMQAELSTDRPLSLSSSQISGMKDIRQQNRQLWPSITIHFSWNNCSAIVGDLVAPLHLVIFSHAPIQVCRYGHRAGRLSHKVFRQRLIVPVCTNIDSLISALLTGEIDDIVICSSQARQTWAQETASLWLYSRACSGEHQAGRIPFQGSAAL